MPLSRNLNIVPAGGSYPVIDGTGTNVAAGKTYWEGCFRYQWAIRQDGDIVRWQCWFGTVAGNTYTGFGIWRQLGLNTTIYRLGLSEDFTARITPNAINTLDLNTPIRDVREGDFSTLKATHPTGMGTLTRRAPRTGSNLYTLVNPSPEAVSPTNWPATTLTADNYIPLIVYMQAPHAVWLTDSENTGSSHKSFADTPVALPYMVDRREASTPFAVSRMVPGFVYQNMARAGETSTQCVARRQADCFDLYPRYCFFCFGTNDNANGISPAQTLAEADTLIADCVAKGVVPVAIGLLPNTASNAVMAERDTINAGFKTRVLAAGGKYIDSQRRLGKKRDGGPEGNRWDWGTDDTGRSYDCGDGNHGSPRAYWELADELVREMGWRRPYEIPVLTGGRAI